MERASKRNKVVPRSTQPTLTRFTTYLLVPPKIPTLVDRVSASLVLRLFVSAWVPTGHLPPTRRAYTITTATFVYHRGHRAAAGNCGLCPTTTVGMSAMPRLLSVFQSPGQTLILDLGPASWCPLRLVLATESALVLAMV
ncbi:hypothetical protein CGRA01v4_11038 [Colletotrichum graminicola]|nr:hypothetical protein CGRA01v4_11038 [Colletotrichum graminicola]